MLLKPAREDMSATVIAISTMLYQRGTRKQLNIEEAKYLAIAKMGRSRIVVSETFRFRDNGDGQEGKINPHIIRVLIR